MVHFDIFALPEASSESFYLGLIATHWLDWMQRPVAAENPCPGSHLTVAQCRKLSARMHETYEHGSLAALKNPVLVAMRLTTGQPGSGSFDGVGFGVVPTETVTPTFGFLVVGPGAIGRFSAGFALITDIKFAGVVGGVWISTTTFAPALLPTPPATFPGLAVVTAMFPGLVVVWAIGLWVGAWHITQELNDNQIARTKLILFRRLYSIFIQLQTLSSWCESVLIFSWTEFLTQNAGFYTKNVRKIYQLNFYLFYDESTN